MRFRTILILLFAARIAAHAGLTFTLTPASQSSAGTNRVVFSGALTNTDTSASLFLNDILIAFNGSGGSYFVADTNVFYANVPGILLPGETYYDVIFAANVAVTPPTGTYSGTVVILGGSDIFAENTLATQSFQISTSISVTLTISLSGNNILLSWPASAGSFVLQQSDALINPNWTDVTNNPVTANGQNTVTLTPSSTHEFYRLSAAP